MNHNIKHVFVLMLENRSFDHMLGFSDIHGKDAKDGSDTQIDGLTTDNFNEYDGVKYYSSPDAPFKLSVDPGHEFMDTFKQICGKDAVYNSETQYNIPKPMSGFVWDFVNSPSKGEGKPINNYGDIMKCYSKDQLPILNSLAKEYVVCDHWFSSIPGPTLPNRFFLHGASSSGLDDSPGNLEIIKWDTIDGFKFQNGSIFDALDKKNIKWRIYCGCKHPIQGSIPCVACLKGITIGKLNHFDNFADDLKDDYDYFYTFIEPNYGSVISGTYNGGTSMHPTDDVRNGEQLIKNVYETIRASKVWDSSVLILTWDEHGGMFDHVVPPKTVAPGDNTEHSTHNFDFTQLGIRVPAIIISPLIEKNIIDHTVYDHTSILATIERLMDIQPLTERDKYAHDFLHLFTLQTSHECELILPEVIFDNNNTVNSTKELENIDLSRPGSINGWIYIIQKLSNELNLNTKIGTNFNLNTKTGTNFNEIKNNIINVSNEIEKNKKH